MAEGLADASEDEELKAWMQAEARSSREVGDGANMAPGNGEVAAAPAGTIVFRPSRSQLKRRRGKNGAGSAAWSQGKR